MQRIALAVTLTLSTMLAAASAAPSARNDSMTGWSPFSFTITEEPVRQAIAELTDRRDTALAQAIAQNPQFAQEFPGLFARFASIALSSVPTPWAMSDLAMQEPFGRDDGQPDEEKPLSGAAWAFAKPAANLFIFTTESAGADIGDNSGGPLPYRYCEEHPTSSLCVDSPPSPLRWALMRRIVSSPRFVRAACPALSTYANWDLQWKIATPANRERFTAFANEFERILDFIYGDGTWTTSRLEGFRTTMGRRLYGIFVRRYLDGGPETIAAIRDCWRGIRAAEEAREPSTTNPPYDGIRRDPSSTDAIAGILRFAAAPEMGSAPHLEVSTEAMGLDAIHRLSHRLSATTALPERFVPTSSEDEGPPDYQSAVFLQTLIGYGDDPSSIGIRAIQQQVPRLLAQLSALDPVYSYRSMNRVEFTRLKAAGLLQAKPYWIVEDGDVLTPMQPHWPKAFIGRKDGVIVDGHGNGTYEFAVVREAKGLATRAR